MRFDCDFIGPLLTSGFTTQGLPALLAARGLSLNETTDHWRTMRLGLHDFAALGGPVRVLRHVVHPLAEALGYQDVQREEAIVTREGPEDGGHSMRAASGALLRVWSFGSDSDLDAPNKRGALARISPIRGAARVLRASGETAGIVTNGTALRFLLCDPAGPDSQIVVALAGRSGWESQPTAPPSYRLLRALASPAGIAASGEIFDAARLHQAGVTKALRSQARAAIEDFLGCVVAQPGNAAALPAPKILWRQALTIIYRLLFILKLESSAEPGGGFGFAASDTWRRAISPNRALGPLVRRHLDLQHDTGRLLEDGLRLLFQICRDGLTHSALSIAPLGGGLFDPSTTEALDALQWGERAVALLLDRLLWTEPRARERERVHYGALDVEELGRVYEALLDLEPDRATEPMVRVRRGRVEAVLPAASAIEGIVEHIAAGRFFLRTGIGRRSGGAYYTPHAFVR